MNEIIIAISLGCILITFLCCFIYLAGYKRGIQEAKEMMRELEALNDGKGD